MGGDCGESYAENALAATHAWDCTYARGIDVGAARGSRTFRAMEAHERLKVWGKLRDVGVRIYRATGPEVQRTHRVLVEDLRAAIIAARVCISMGVAARDDAVFAERLERALGSLRRAESFVHLAHDVRVLPPKEFAVIEARLAEVQAMLVGLRRRVLGRLKVA